MDEATYVTFGIPTFEKRQQKDGFFRRLISRHKIVKSNEREENEECVQPKDTCITIPDSEYSLSVVSDHSSDRQASPLKRLHMPLHSTGSGIGHLPVDRRYWMLDESCRQCFECGSRFTTLRRKHHCRLCGRIFCYQCSNKFVEGEEIGMSGLQRVCNYCASSLPSRLSSGSFATQNSDRSYSSQSGLEDSPILNAVFDTPTRSHAVRTRHTHSELAVNRRATITTVNDAEAILSAALAGQFRSELSNLGESDVSPDTGRSHSPIAPPSKMTLVSAVSGGVFSGISQTKPTSVDPATSIAPLFRRVGSRTTEDPSDTYVHSLLTRMLGAAMDADCQDVLGSGAVAKELPIITISQERRTLLCVSGISLIYWLISNVPEIQRCRSKARSICQRFVDLSLITPLNRMDVGEFRDDFTPYRIENPSSSIAPSASHMHDRRVSWPPSHSSPSLDFHKSGGLDEPEWLRETEASLPHSYPPLSDSVQITVDEDHSSTTQVTRISSQPPNDTLLDFGMKTSTHVLQSTESFEMGVDVRLTPESIDDSSLSALPDGVKPCVSDLLNTVFMRTSLSSTADAKVEPKFSSMRQDLLQSIRPHFEAHLQRLVLQDVRSNHLDPSWVSILIALAHDVCDLVRFDLRSPGFRSFAPTHTPDSRRGELGMCKSAVSRPTVYSPMDIRYYVHVKKLPDTTGCPSDVYPGVAFTKRTTHKFLPSLLKDARVLLLASCIDYQRASAKMVWLESQIMQEEEYLSNCVSRLLCFHPNLLIVGDTVSHTAQMMLVKAGITVLCNVKRSVLLRIARVTGADIIESVDRLISEVPTKSSSVARVAPQLGYSQHFEVKPVRLSHGGVKFLSYIKNLQNADAFASADKISAPSGTPRYTTGEATVILRGPDLAALKRAKRCFLFALCACSNMRMEMQYALSAFMYRPSRSLGPDFTSPSFTQPVDSLRSSSQRKSKTPVESRSTLMHYLSGRLFNLSPGVHLALPFLTFANEQQAPLGAYYTYIVEWPFGRILNDLLKRKLKVINSNLYALERENQNSSTQYTDLAVLPEQHEFLKCNLVFQPSSLLHTLEKQVHKRCTFSESCIAMNKSANTNALLMSEVIAPQSEALYVDFKARAFALATSDVSRTNRSVRSTIINGLKHLISLHDSPPMDVRDKRLGCRPSDKSGANKAATAPERLSTEAAVANKRAKRLKRSILDPRSHQYFSFLTMLFSSKSPMWPEPCVQPWISSVDFYGQQDLPLGLFLEKCCFSPRPCRHPHCALPMVDHVQRFVRTDGYVQLSIHKCTRDSGSPIYSIPDAFPRMPGTTRPYSRILMWLFCPDCRISTSLVYLSGDIWHYSFVKFLDQLISTPSDWTRCAMRVVTVSVNKSIEEASHAIVHSTERTVESDNQGGDKNSLRCPSISAPAWQRTCMHSAHKALKHCFSLGRKVAVFQYRPATIYEVVMPPNEIRIHPSAAAAAASRLFASDHMPPLVQPKSTSNSSCSYGSRFSDPEQRMPPLGSGAPLPAYLHAEAVDAWEKYYRVYATVKSHLVTLVQDNTNPELSQMLEDYVYILEMDGRRSHMEYRAELLRYMIELETKPPSTSHARSTESASPHSTQLPLTSNFIAPHRVPLNVNVQDTLVCQGSAVSASLQCENNSLDELSSSSSSLPLRHTVHDSTTPTVASVTIKEEDQLNTSDSAPKWTALVMDLDATEKTFVVQTLINELKRWIYIFISEWNSRCAEYDLQLRRAEKTAKELRKKPGSTYGCASPLPQRHVRKSQLSVSESETNSAYDDEPPSDYDRAAFRPPLSADDHTNSAKVLLNSDLSTYRNNPLLPSAVGPLTFEISDKTSLPTSDSQTTPTISRVWSDGTTQSMCLGNQKLRVRGLDLATKFGSSPDSLSNLCGYNTVITPNSTVTDPSLTSVNSGDGLDKRERDTLQKTIDSACSPLLDPVNPKVPACYPTQDLVTVSSSSTPPLRVKNSHSPAPEPMFQATGISVVPTSLTVPSGVRRLINTLMPSSNDAKVFEEPFPAYEHPQLTLIDSSRIGLFGFSSITSVTKYSAESGKDVSNSEDYMRHLIHHLKIATPDVYVNDRELTSIVAFALS
ncbi:unnamed protein product [Dicrocoelium dendriticum]|nr:unnamed protein product [Dicrocoelium dendriticum]